MPVAYLVVRAGGAGSDAWSDTLRGDLLPLVVRSLGLALAVAGAAVVIAVPYAWLVTRSDLPGRGLWAVLGALPLVIPSYVGAVALLGAFGPKGLLQQALAPLGVERLPEIYGFYGSWLTLTLFTYPYVLLVTMAALRRMDHSLERAARGMGRGPWRVFTSVVLPQLRSSIAAGVLLVMLYVLGDFGVVSFMRFPTFTRQIYIHYGSLYDSAGAAVLSLVLVSLTAVVLIGERRMLRGAAHAARQRVSAREDRVPVHLGPWRWLATTFCATVALFALAVPLGVLLWWVATRQMDTSIAEGLLVVADALVDSLSASVAGAIVSAALALPIALLVVRAPGWLSSLTEGTAYLGFALPGIVAALGLVFFAIRVAPAIYQTLLLLVVAYVIRFLPQSIGATRAALERVNPRLEAAARGMGAGSWQSFRRVTLPLAAPGVLAGAVLVFLTAMKELPATLLLRPTGFESLATEIWQQSTVADYPDAALPSLALVAISAVPLYLLVIRPARPGRD